MVKGMLTSRAGDPPESQGLNTTNWFCTHMKSDYTFLDSSWGLEVGMEFPAPCRHSWTQGEGGKSSFNLWLSRVAWASISSQ